MTAQRSKSIDALYRNIKTVWPGVVVGWIRTTPGSASGHYPDDTPGVTAELSDTDTLQEVRALDPMLGPAFNREDAGALVNVLVGRCQARLYYVIWNGHIWSRKSAWKPVPYDGRDPHTGHVHISGWAGDDANGADWAPVLALGDMLMALRDDDDFRAVMDRVNALLSQADPAVLKLSTGNRTEPNNLRRSLTRLEQSVARVEEAIEALATAVAGLANGDGATTAEIAEELGSRLLRPPGTTLPTPGQ